MKSASEIRQQFLDFFQSKKHTLVPSSPVIAVGDPTLLFINAGMNQFKDVFLGTGKRDYTRCANTQKCIRVSGKHNDLEEVGVDTYHHTFFEMLGNWSFGDYFKKESIEWAFELLTQVYGIDSSKLYATIFQGDEQLKIPQDVEAESLWLKYSNLPQERILKFGKKDNFWEMGEVGPCGPCTEIHMDRGEGTCDQLKTPGHLCNVNAGCARFIEICNLVFIQYNRMENGELKILPNKHVDTGMGLERLTAILQKKNSNYDTDLFTPIFESLQNLSQKKYGKEEKTDIAFRVIADHIRTLTVAFADNGFPSNKGAGYVLRRILRRAVRYGYQTLELQKPFLYQLVPSVSKILGRQFPEIQQREKHIQTLIEVEEKSFLNTLNRGIVLFEELAGSIKKEKKKIIPGAAAFDLYSTYGFPKDLIALMGRENKLSLDEEGWNTAEEKHRTSGANTQFVYEKNLDELQGLTKTETVFYRDHTQQEKEGTYCKSTLVKLIGTDRLVINPTPFYAESGGQLGDSGWVQAKNFRFRVEDTQKQGETLVHYGQMEEGDLNDLPKKVEAFVDYDRRKALMANHSATHLLHWALRSILGDSVSQKGSLVAPDRLRFDFTHLQAVTPEELTRIENLINEKIMQNTPVGTQLEDLESAKKGGAIAMFGEKYADQVRVVKMGESKELCGGTHVCATGDIGVLMILSETAVQTGVRRITAITRLEALKYMQKDRELIDELRLQLKSPKIDLLPKISQLQEELKKERQNRERLEDQVGGFLGALFK
ncbi:MAG: alanine--tRNA ligase, partial [Planctomycetota bacterium]